MTDVFIIGAKGLGNYGGYETFVDKLTELHQNDNRVHYHIACKANGKGWMDETKLQGVTKISKDHFVYHNADCFKIHIPEKMGSAQAIYYDYKALESAISYCKEHKIKNPVFYVLACRIGPFASLFARRIHKIGGLVFVNPDGHEWMRAKWSKPVRMYWKWSEKLMTKHADLMVCDSVNIEKYIQDEYAVYKPRTVYIAYGADIRESKLLDSDPKYQKWMKDNNVKKGKYYLIVGRFVPENNFETMIREFMRSHSKKDLVIITTKDEEFLKTLNLKLHFDSDSRIKFVGTVYDQELLKKIRENAYGYLHGHSVGGTNPSLLEALGSTKLNLLLDVGFNQEVGANAALYWNKDDGVLSKLIDSTDLLSQEQIDEYGKLAKERIETMYSWESIGDKYLQLFVNAHEEMNKCH